MTADLAQVLEEAGRLSAEWAGERAERQARRHLEPADFEALAAAGYLRAIVPAEHGGLWESLSHSARPNAEILRTLAQGDPSVALVAAMHPAVLSFWLLPVISDSDWLRQREAVFATAVAGTQWGTITSEPGSGGDISRTRAAAVRDPDLDLALPGAGYRITGDKHFGSGTGISSFMITTGLPDERPDPAIFVLDTASRPWERQGEGMILLGEWDGMGMAATQSHSMRLDAMPAVRYAWDGPVDAVAHAAGPLGMCLFTAVVLGILDSAVGMARSGITHKADRLRPYEQVEWTRAEMDHWLAVQAYEGALRAVESAPTEEALGAALRAKQSVARLAEDVLVRLTRVLGGGTFSQRSPFSHWFEDVRALGFLRPPWGLAYDGLFSSSLEAR